MYGGFLGSAGTRFVLQRSNDIYLQHYFHSVQPVLYRQTYVCLAWGLGGIYLESAQNPNALAALVFDGDIDDAHEEEDGDYMPVDEEGGEDMDMEEGDDGGMDPEHLEDEFDFEEEAEPDEFGDEQDHIPEAVQPDDPMPVEIPVQVPELDWEIHANIAALLVTWDFGPSADPLLANPHQQQVANFIVDGEMKDGFNMAWNHTLTEQKQAAHLPLHYHQHEERHDHGPVAPKILAEHDGKHHQFLILQYGSQVQAFRKARSQQPVGHA